VPAHVTVALDWTHLPALEEERATLFISPSGTQGAWAEPSAEGRLYERLATLLAERGIGTVRFDVPLRDDRARPASPRHVAARAECLVSALEQADAAGGGTRPSLWLGTSLGADAALHALERPPHAFAPPSALILVGALVEMPRRLPREVASVDLVTGSGDYVAFGDDPRPVPPDVHAARSADMLRSSPGRPVRLHVLPGFDHTLTHQARPGLPSDAAPPLAAVVSAAADRIAAGTSEPAGAAA
jgi:hypothetical protein